MGYAKAVFRAVLGVAVGAATWAPAGAAPAGIVTERVPLPVPPALRLPARFPIFDRGDAGPHFVRYFPIPGTTPFFVAFGPGHDYWFTTGDQPGSIGKIGPKQPFELFGFPPSGPDVSLRIVDGPDGNLWATLDGGIAKITPAGAITVYPLTRPGADLGYIAVGPDANLWFTEHDANMFGRITPSGTITEFPFEDIGAPNGIVTGPDGRLWICEQGALSGSTGHQTFGRIERVTVQGKIVGTYPLTPGNWQNVPEDITVGADRRLWFTQFNAIAQTIYEISNVSRTGQITEYKTPNANAGPGSPILGGDGNVWFSEAYAAQLGRVTPNGAITEFPLPQGTAGFPTAPYGLAHNARQIWFADYQNGRLGRFTI